MSQEPSFEFLLDTNILLDLIRFPTGRVYQKFKEVGPQKVGTSIVVACELRFGAAKRGSRKLANRIDLILENLPILPLDPPVDETYGHLRLGQEKNGYSVGPNDLFIAAQALGNDLTLVTANFEEFRRIPKLCLENWLD